MCRINIGGIEMFRFRPNKFGKRFFNLKEDEYSGEGLTGLFEGVLGKQDYDEYMIAQDPFVGGGWSSRVVILLNREAAFTEPLEFATIGVVERDMDSVELALSVPTQQSPFCFTNRKILTIMRYIFI
jgi:hypothetical protein